MTVEMIITLATLGVVVLAGLITIAVALIRGDMKKFVEEKMIEAEKTGASGAEKLQYVILAVDEKYKVLKFLLNVKKFVEYIIVISKQINVK